MAQRRLLNKSLGTSSKKFAKLNERAGTLADFCQALYPLIMANCDDHGRLAGDAFSIKMTVFPISRHSEDDFEEALQALHDVSLINLYTVDGSRYLYLHNFRKEQPGIKYVANPLYPSPPPEAQQKEQFTGTRRDSPNFSQDKKRCRREVEEKKEKRNAAGAASVDPSPSAESVRLSELLRTAIATRDPHSRAAKLPDTAHWARDIEKLISIDHRQTEDIEKVIAWCQKNDCFWGPNILSGRKLREHFDTMWGQMHRAPGTNGNGAGHKATADLYVGKGEENKHGANTRSAYAAAVRGKPAEKRDSDEIKFLEAFDNGVFDE